MLAKYITSTGIIWYRSEYLIIIDLGEADHIYTLETNKIHWSRHSVYVRNRHDMVYSINLYDLESLDMNYGELSYEDVDKLLLGIDSFLTGYMSVSNTKSVKYLKGLASILRSLP